MFKKPPVRPSKKQRKTYAEFKRKAASRANAEFDRLHGPARVIDLRAEASKGNP